MTVNIAMNVGFYNPPPPVTAPFAGPGLNVCTPGLDFSLCASPLHSLVSSIQATICDQQVSSNLAQNREIMQLLTDTPQDRAWRTYPTYLDTYTWYNDATGTNQNPISGFDSSVDASLIGNGSWPLQFTGPNGNVGDNNLPLYPVGSTTYTFTDPAGYIWTVVIPAGSIPQIWAWPVAPAGAPALVAFPAGFNVPVYFNFTSTEPLQVSPFIWREMQERRTGLSQLQNLNIVMNMQTPSQARLVRWSGANNRYVMAQLPSAVSRGVSGVNYLSLNGSPFQAAGLTSQFLSPPLSSELPYQPINTVDFQNVQAYVYPGMMTAGGRVTTQTLSLNTIPDWLVVAVQPQASWTTQPWTSQFGTFYMPIVNVALSWSNVSGLLSTQTQQQLYHMCKANRLKMTWEQWRGYAQTSGGPVPTQKSLTGGPLVLRPGIDLTLPPGQASGQSNGQWTFQADIQIDMSHLPLAPDGVSWPNAGGNGFVPKGTSLALTYGWGLQTTVLSIISGFFTTSSGSSRIVTGPVDGPASKGGNPEDMFALASIPSSGPLYRPSEIALTAMDRMPGAGGGHPGRRTMSSRVRPRRG